MSRMFFPALVVLIAADLVSGSGAVRAQSATGLTGNDQLHEQARLGGKICMTAHEHGGEGSLPSRKGAEAAAIRHWEGFTTWEYGKPWGKYSLAVGKNMECANNGSVWVCNTRARPCRPAGASRPAPSRSR